VYLCELLDPVEAGYEGEGQVALGRHLPPQEEIPLQVVRGKVVLTATVSGSVYVHQING
jgi:hypothetical protein